MTFEKAVSIVMKNEGGYVDDPTDPGGETKYGISKRSYPHLDIAEITDEQARSIYFNDFWLKARIAEMPERLRASMLDMAVLHGVRGAVRVLQQAIVGSGHIIKVDGVIGAITLAEAPYCDPDRLRAYRVLCLARKIVKKPYKKRYWYGWYKRAVSV